LVEHNRLVSPLEMCKYFMIDDQWRQNKQNIVSILNTCSK